MYSEDGAHGVRRARQRSSRLLFALLLVGAAAALLLLALVVFAADALFRQIAGQGALALTSGIIAVLLLAAAVWQHVLLKQAHGDGVVLERTVDALRRRGAYEEAQAQLMTRISDLIEVFTRTRNLEAVLNEAVRALQGALGVSFLVLQLYEEEGGRFTLSIEEGGEGLELGDATSSSTARADSSTTSPPPGGSGTSWAAATPRSWSPPSAADAAPPTAASG